jgi:hypothetical protein
VANSGAGSANRPEDRKPTTRASGADAAGLTLTPGSAKKVPKEKAAAPKKSRAKTPWPAQRAAQVEAVFAALSAASELVTAKDLAATFARGDAKAITEILSALVTLGRIQRGPTKGTFVS